MFNSIHEVDIGDLKRTAKMAHYFGLGFIQIKLNDEWRIHFYHPELPAITSEEEVHNHRYGFTSYILAGELTQELFQRVPETAGRDEGYPLAIYQIELESCKEGPSEPVVVGRYGLKRLSKQTMVAGSNYRLHCDTLHRVTMGPEGCVTLLQRGPVVKPAAEVARPVDAPKICPFSMKLSPDKLWETVDSMLKKFKVVLL